MPDTIWAEVWWREACRLGLVLNLSTPPAVHKYLLEQFATDQGFMSSKRPIQHLFIKSESNLAIWRLVRYQQMISLINILKDQEDEVEDTLPFFQVAREEIASVHQEDLDVDYTGLNGDYSSVVKEFIHLSYQLITSSAAKKDVDSASLKVYLHEIRKYLKRPGLVGRIACRCLVSIMPSVTATSTEADDALNKRDLRFLARDLQPYYEKPITDRVKPRSVNLLFNRLSYVRATRLHRLMYSGPVPVDYYYSGYHVMSPLPKYIRIKSGGEFVALIDLLKKQIHDGRELPFKWITNMILPDQFIRPLVEGCTEYLPKLLAWLGEHRFASLDSSRRLRVQHSQRILAIARKSKDPKILAGVATALTVANYYRIAEPEIILKLTRAVPYSQFATTLFPTNFSTSRHYMGQSSSKVVKTLEIVAESILKTPKIYAFQVVCNAAVFLAEYKRPSLKPLLQEEELQEAVKRKDDIL